MNFRKLTSFLWTNPLITMPLILAVWGIIYISTGAVINAGEGLGYDGTWYAHITKNLFSLISNNELSTYRIQRILPCIIAKIILVILNLPQENYFIVKLFQYLNLILLILSSILWIRIAEFYNLSIKYVWTGFVLGFVNFGIVMMPYFMPVLTDVPAFFLGFCLLYYYLKNNLTAKIIITFLGAFTWPLFIYIGILMIIFPVNFRLETTDLKSGRFTIFNKLLVFLLPLSILAISINTIFQFLSGVEIKGIYTQPIKSTLYVSAVLNYFVVAYFLYVFLPVEFTFKSYIQFVKRVFKSINKKHILISVLLYAVVQIICRLLGNPEIEPEASPGYVFFNIAIYGATKPLVYIVTAIAYFGPMYMILFLFLKQYKSQLLQAGTGVYISFMLTFMLILTSETRLIMNFIPVIILLTVLVIRDLQLDKSLLILLSLFAVILSKFYVPMSGVPDNMDKFSFISQMYFMNTYMVSKTFYYYQAIFTLALIIIFLFLYRNRKSKLTQINF